jgi:hypothetical protein
MPYIPTTCSEYSRFDKTELFYRESQSTDAKRFDTLYGVDPVSAVIMDRSISRTWPISSCTITLSTTNNRIPWYPTITYTLPQTGTLQDRQSQYTPLMSNMWRYGEYMVTMNVQASTTSTSSDKPFIQYISISEFEPFANFWAISAQTVSATYTCSNTAASSQLINITTVPNATSYDSNNTPFHFVSGYAPHLTVYFKDSSEAHTFPISSYHWNFGDIYNEGPEDITNINSNYYTITNVSITGGSFVAPCWRTNKQGHIAQHTYTMPGTYLVSLEVRANETSTSDICSRFISEVDGVSPLYYVYVDEIPPTCNSPIKASEYPLAGYTNAPSGIVGGLSLTAFFTASSIIPGSFPIDRIDWDFGDGTTQSITRYPVLSTTDQGLNVVNISAYTYDMNDPRNIAVPHAYNNTTGITQLYNIGITAYACNTNTSISCSAGELIRSISFGVSSDNTSNTVTRVGTDERKLIGSRIDDSGNVIYILERQENNTLYTVALSGEVSND